MTDDSLNEQKKKSNIEFNKEFEEYKKIMTEKNKEIDKRKLKDIVKTSNFHNITIQDILIGIKDTWFGIFDDIIHKNISFNIITKNNRLLFIGISIIILSLILFVLTELTDGS